MEEDWYPTNLLCLSQSKVPALLLSEVSASPFVKELLNWSNPDQTWLTLDYEQATLNQTTANSWLDWTAPKSAMRRRYQTKEKIHKD